MDTGGQCKSLHALVVSPRIGKERFGGLGHQREPKCSGHKSGSGAAGLKHIHKFHQRSRRQIFEGSKEDSEQKVAKLAKALRLGVRFRLDSRRRLGRTPILRFRPTTGRWFGSLSERRNFWRVCKTAATVCPIARMPLSCSKGSFPKKRSLPLLTLLPFVQNPLCFLGYLLFKTALLPFVMFLNPRRYVRKFSDLCDLLVQESFFPGLLWE